MLRFPAVIHNLAFKFFIWLEALYSTAYFIFYGTAGLCAILFSVIFCSFSSSNIRSGPVCSAPSLSDPNMKRLCVLNGTMHRFNTTKLTPNLIQLHPILGPQKPIESNEENVLSSQIDRPNIVIVILSTVPHKSRYSVLRHVRLDWRATVHFREGEKYEL